MTILELGQLMKQKYPQYKEIPDEELGNRILAKYPEYQGRISRPEVKDTRSGVEKVASGAASIVGGKKLAEAGGQLLAGDQSESLATQNAQIIESLVTQAKKYPVGHPRRTEFLKQANQTAKQYTAVADERLESLPTQKEVAGSAVKLASTVGTLGLGAASAASAGGRILETGAKLGGMSALSGGSTAFEEGLGRSEAVKGALGSGAVGFALGSVGQSIAELATFLTSPAVSEGLYNRALGISKKTVEKGKSPSEMLIKEGVMGTQPSMLQKTNQISRESEKQVVDILANNSTKIRSQDVVGKIQEELGRKFQNTLSADEIKAVVDKLPLNVLRGNKSISVDKLNALRSELDNNYLGSARWLNDSTAERIVGLKTATNVMRGMVQATDERLPAIFSKWSDAITASRALRSELAKPHILSNMLELLTSMAIGGATGGLSMEGLKNALYTFGAINAYQSAPVKTGIAQGLSKLGQSQAGLGAVKTLVPGLSAELTK